MVSHGRCLTGKDIILVCRIVQTSTILYALRKASIYCEVHSNMCNYCPIYIHLYQGNINCGTSSQTDFILNYLSSNFLSNFLKYVSKSPFSPSPASRLKQLISPWYIDIYESIFLLSVLHRDMFRSQYWFDKGAREIRNCQKKQQQTLAMNYCSPCPKWTG